MSDTGIRVAAALAAFACALAAVLDRLVPAALDLRLRSPPTDGVALASSRR